MINSQKLHGNYMYHLLLQHYLLGICHGNELLLNTQVSFFVSYPNYSHAINVLIFNKAAVQLGTTVRARVFKSRTAGLT